MIRKNTFAGALLLAGLFLASRAEAYSYWECGGVKVVWTHGFEMVQNAYSIPFLSKREASLDNGINRWRNVKGMNDMVSKSAVVNFTSSITNGNGQNDAAIVKRSNIGGANGLTLKFHDGCFFGGDMEWTEADVMVASDLGFGQLGETTLSTSSGRSTFLHEFGHAHGLEHDQLFNHMRATQPRPLVGGPGETLDVLPDDAQGGRFLYPSGKTEVNVFASAHRRKSSTDTILVNASGTITTCTSGGGVITVNATAGNNGTVDVTQDERWWLSTSKSAHSGGIEIGKLKDTSFPANKVKTKQVTLTLPPLAAGTYFLYHGIDVLTEVQESRDDDNAAREALVIQVNNC